MKAIGYLKLLEDGTNKFLITFLHDILTFLDMWTKSFQTVDKSLAACLDILKTVQKRLQERKLKYTEEYIKGVIDPDEDVPRAKRQRKLPGSLADSVVTSRLPIFMDETSRLLFSGQLSWTYWTDRFSDGNVICWAAMRCLLPSSPDFLDQELLLSLIEYTNSIPIFAEVLEPLGNLKGLKQLFSSRISWNTWSWRTLRKT